jgi:prepilin-type processing-associated H-X9-DG protein
VRQIGTGLQLYIQDYDERIPDACSPGRMQTWTFSRADITGACAQMGINQSTPKNTFLGLEQTPPRYIQELLYPYVKSVQLWFCPSVGKDRFYRGDRTLPTYGYNGTTYMWHAWPDPTVSSAPRELRGRQPIDVGGLPIAAIPRPSEAPLLWDTPFWNPVKEPCLSNDLKPAHAKGLNVLYADGHARYSPFTGRLTPEEACNENWWAENTWRGFFE